MRVLFSPSCGMQGRRGLLHAHGDVHASREAHAVRQGSHLLPLLLLTRQGERGPVAVPMGGIVAGGEGLESCLGHWCSHNSVLHPCFLPS